MLDICSEIIFDRIRNRAGIYLKFKLKLLLPKLLFEPYLPGLTDSELVKFAVLTPPQICLRQKDKRQDNHNKNVSKRSQITQNKKLKIKNKNYGFGLKAETILSGVLFLYQQLKIFRRQLHLYLI
jgi:hypothetical protein